MKRILAMLTEPSTWAGLSVLGGLFSVNPQIFTSLHGIAVGAASLAAVLLPEKAAV